MQRPVDLSSTSRHTVHFTAPDAVSELTEQDQQSRVEYAWNRDDLLLVDGLGCFVRCLVEATCTEGHPVVVNLWAALDEEHAQRAVGLWWGPEYASLAMPGRLANSLPYQGLLDAQVRLAVRDEQSYPFVEPGPDPRVAEILRQPWPHSDLVKG
ncbi:DUF2199 domain-containing protein [Micromonospora tarensis]|uniref:DUF2199 domain-containing protein n=1 Tax=Micromonospora tarensis TaxID=2806100 RepID=A0ABS1YFP2_9ACTN|nr:DUF2199 domain-containing protein [Micromonospora tarensis]MBM0276229.1 DUF2199 domain-containing protein [Micromonospora tarensis]